MATIGITNANLSPIEANGCGTFGKAAASDLGSNPLLLTVERTNIKEKRQGIANYHR